MMHNYRNNECKTILVGNLRVGKTSLVRRLIGTSFSYNYEPTIGVDFALLKKSQ